jgi:hypothetical protein
MSASAEPRSALLAKTDAFFAQRLRHFNTPLRTYFFAASITAFTCRCMPKPLVCCLDTTV